jgi:hypothetical protein
MSHDDLAGLSVEDQITRGVQLAKSSPHRLNIDPSPGCQLVDRWSTRGPPERVIDGKPDILA